jgi:hypothetical protein
MLAFSDFNEKLIHACEIGDFNQIKHMTPYCFDPTQIDTGIEIATKFGHLNIVEFLLKRSKRTNLWYIFQVACKYNHRHIIDYIYKNGIDNYDMKYGFLTACENGHLGLVKWFITLGTVYEYNEGLYRACKNSCLEIVDYFCNDLKRKFKIDYEKLREGAKESNNKTTLKHIEEIIEKHHPSKPKYIPISQYY